MERILELIDKLKLDLDQTEEVKKIKYLNEKIKNDKELMQKIELYKQNGKEQLKEEIYSNEIYKEYKEAETDLNILIMNINSKLKKITSRGKCKI